MTVETDSSPNDSSKVVGVLFIRRRGAIAVASVRRSESASSTIPHNAQITVQGHLVSNLRSKSKSFKEPVLNFYTTRILLREEHSTDPFGAGGVVLL